MYRLLCALLLILAAAPTDRTLVGTFSAPVVVPHQPITLVLQATATVAEPERYTMALAVPEGLDVLAIEASPATLCIPFPEDTLSCYGAIGKDAPVTVTATLVLEHCTEHMRLALPASLYIRETYTSLTKTLTIPVAPPCPLFLPIIGRDTSVQ